MGAPYFRTEHIENLKVKFYFQSIFSEILQSKYVA